jgi:hypothetical protein
MYVSLTSSSPPHISHLCLFPPTTVHGYQVSVSFLHLRFFSALILSVPSYFWPSFIPAPRSFVTAPPRAILRYFLMLRLPLLSRLSSHSSFPLARECCRSLGSPFCPTSSIAYRLLVFRDLVAEQLKGKRPVANILAIELDVSFTFDQRFVASPE